MATNYPTYTAPRTSNMMRTGAQTSNMTRQTQPTYGTDMGMTRATQPQANAWDPNRYMQQRQTTQPQSRDLARGGGVQTRPQNTYIPSAMPGQQTITRGDASMTYGDPPPQQPQYNSSPGQQATANQFGYYPGLDPTTLQSNDEREAALQAVQANIPISQLNQNAYQYSTDFNEAQRRDDRNFGYQQTLDAQNIALALRQQGMSEWQANEAANQWAADHNRNLNNDAFQQDFSQQQFGLQDYSTREGLRQSDYQNQQNALYQQGQLGIGNRELDIRDSYQQGQLGIGNRQIDVQRELGLGQQQVAQQANDINRAYNEGRLSNEQRQLALSELTQTQNYGLAQNQQSMQQQELARRFGLDTTTQEQLNSYRNAQLAQEAQLAAQQMAAQQQIATMQQFGRNRAPNTRWIRG
jgi:hypothetical protein